MFGAAPAGICIGAFRDALGPEDSPLDPASFVGIAIFVGIAGMTLGMVTGTVVGGRVVGTGGGATGIDGGGTGIGGGVGGGGEPAA